MTTPAPRHDELEFHPLDATRWHDLEQLFGPSGAHGGCWCMWWRIKRKTFEENGNEANRRAFEQMVTSGTPTGVLAYRGERAVGWCSVAPRETYTVLERSRVLRALDEQPVWSILCFFVAKDERGHAMAEELIEAAVDYARGNGARIVEAYPTDPRGRRLAPVSSFMGLPSFFERQGFVECKRPSKARVIMRRQLG
jgi:GNAT superfamily N-acetyltransferase